MQETKNADIFIRENLAAVKDSIANIHQKIGLSSLSEQQNTSVATQLIRDSFRSAAREVAYDRFPVYGAMVFLAGLALGESASLISKGRNDISMSAAVVGLALGLVYVVRQVTKNKRDFLAQFDAVKHDLPNPSAPTVPDIYLRARIKLRENLHSYARQKVEMINNKNLAALNLG